MKHQVPHLRSVLRRASKSVLFASVCAFGLAALALLTPQQARVSASSVKYHQQMGKVFRTYEIVSLNPSELARKARRAEVISVRTAQGSIELALTPHDLRAPGYFAEETGEGGVRRRLPSAPVRTFKGKAQGLRAGQARFTIDDATFEGAVIAAGESYFIEPAREYVPTADAADFVMYKASDVDAVSGASCALALSDEVRRAGDGLIPPIPSAGSPATEVSRPHLDTDLATEADHEYVAAFGSSTAANDEILSILNQVEGAYQVELGFNFTIAVTAQHTWGTAADPYNATAALDVLIEFKDYWNSSFTNIPRDLAHMWTGKPIGGGIAYLGVACSQPGISYGLSQMLSFTPDKFVLTAHELAHNFNATHSDAVGSLECFRSTMNHFITPYLTFCQFTRDEITNYVNANSGCLSASPIRTLTVGSVKPPGGVGITLSPGDADGLGDGTTQFTRSYNQHTNVTLTAPADADGSTFQKWQRDGVDFASTRTTTVTMDDDHTMTAVYVRAQTNSLAAYDPSLKAPVCAQPAAVCDSGDLLDGRGNISGGPEPNQPNTINNSCADDSSGTYHVDESLDRIKISTLDGGPLRPGAAVRIEATVWPWRAPAQNHLDLFHAPDATNPAWTRLATIEPNVAGGQVLSATFTLPDGGSLQAVRGVFRYQGGVDSCDIGPHLADHDDLAFAVGGGGGVVNVALAANGATATASSTLDAGRSAEAAINGDRNGIHWGAGPSSGSGWHDATGDAFPDWIEVSFAGVKTISEVSVFTLQDDYTSPSQPTEGMEFTLYGATDFQVQYWSGAAWLDVPDGNVTGNTRVWRKFAFAPISTPKIRVLVNSARAGYSRIVEVEAWVTGASGCDPANKALACNGATATASSTLDSVRLPAAAINGDRRGLHWGSDPSTGSGWHDATNNAYPDWLEVAFNGAQTINQINVYTIQDNYLNPVEPDDSTTFSLYGINAFRVEYWNGFNWVTVRNVTGNDKVRQSMTFNAVTTSKIRVVVDGAQAGHSRIVEVEALHARINFAAAANGGMAAASSTLDSNRRAAAAINGDRRGLHWGSDPVTGSGWHDATGNAYPDWLEVTFGGARLISEVHVFTIQDNFASPSEPTESMTFTKFGITDFEIQYLDGDHWFTLPRGDIKGNDKVWRRVTFVPLFTKRVRVLVNGSLAGYSRVTEIEVY